MYHLGGKVFSSKQASSASAYGYQQVASPIQTAARSFRCDLPGARTEQVQTLHFNTNQPD